MQVKEATAPNRDPWITALSHLPSSKSVNAPLTILVASRDQVTAFEEMSEASPAWEETSTTRLEPTILAEEMGGEIATLAINEPGSILAIGEQASWEIERGRNIISHFFSCINGYDNPVYAVTDNSPPTNNRMAFLFSVGISNVALVTEEGRKRENQGRSPRSDPGDPVTLRSRVHCGFRARHSGQEGPEGLGNT